MLIITLIIFGLWLSWQRCGGALSHHRVFWDRHMRISAPSIHSYSRKSRNLFTCWTGKATRAGAYASEVITRSATRARIASWCTLAGVLSYRVIWTFETCCGVIPFICKKGVAFQGSSSCFLPGVVFGAGLLVHGILSRGAFHERTIGSAKSDITETAILQVWVPCIIVRDEKVVIIRRRNRVSAFIFTCWRYSELLRMHLLWEVDREIHIWSAGTVTRAFVWAGSTLAGRTFVARKTLAFPS